MNLERVDALDTISHMQTEGMFMLGSQAMTRACRESPLSIPASGSVRNSDLTAIAFGQDAQNSMNCMLSEVKTRGPMCAQTSCIGQPDSGGLTRPDGFELHKLLLAGHNFSPEALKRHVM